MISEVAFEQISGTYCHPDLIPSIAGWISPEFQLKANRVVNGYIIAQYKTQLAAAKQELKDKQLELEWNIELRDAATEEAHEALDYAETVKKESVITQASLILANKENTSLSNANNSLTRRNSTLSEFCEKYKGLVEDSNKRMNGLFDGWNMTTDLLKTTSTSLVNTRKRMAEWSKENGFAIMIKNCCVEPLPYYTIRCRNENMGPALKRFKSRYPTARGVFGTQCVPNGVNLFHQLKKLPGARYHRNHYDPECSEDELRAKLIDMCYPEL